MGGETESASFVVMVCLFCFLFFFLNLYNWYRYKVVIFLSSSFHQDLIEGFFFNLSLWSSST